MRNGIRHFFELESAGGILLVAAAILAMLLANSPVGPLWLAWLAQPLADLPVLTPHHIVNDGLMSLFFLLVGLELKRQLPGTDGCAAIAVPLAAALGGMIAPCLLYLAVTSGTPNLGRGWAIPAATDIAFALAVLQVVRAPAAVKLFLTTLAVLDDLGAILIIGLFYVDTLNLVALGLALVPLSGLIGCNRSGVQRVSVYMGLGFMLWLAVCLSGLHPTLAGVATAFCVPRARAGRVESILHPPIVFIVLPLFAIVNAGVVLTGLTPDDLLHPLPIGIACGLLLGKPLGIVGGALLAMTLKRDKLPFTMRHLLGAGCLGGIGFTMSLFVGTLAFDDAHMQNLTLLGVVAGSLLSAASGWLFLRPHHPLENSLQGSAVAGQ